MSITTKNHIAQRETTSLLFYGYFHTIKVAGLLHTVQPHYYINRYVSNSDPLSTPILPIERVVAYSLRDMLRHDMLHALKVGDGARNLYYAVIGTCREVEVGHGTLQ